MDIQRLAETLGIGAFIIAALTYLLRSIWGQMLSRDLEKFKTDLRTAAFEQETRFARLHERRAAVTATAQFTPALGWPAALASSKACRSFG